MARVFFRPAPPRRPVLRAFPSANTAEPAAQPEPSNGAETDSEAISADLRAFLARRSAQARTINTSPAGLLRESEAGDGGRRLLGE